MNKLEELWKSMFEKKVEKETQKRQSSLFKSAGFLGQHVNQDRQTKHRLMVSLHLKTGKAYRKYLKRFRAENKADAERLAKANTPAI
jgi:hypothetical protein